MSEFTRQPDAPSRGVSPKHRETLIRRGPDGVLERVNLSERSMKRIKSATPDQLCRYFDVVMGRVKKADRPPNDQFRDNSNKITCLICADAGFVTVPERTDLGMYDFVWLCLCQEAVEPKPPTDSIRHLSMQGLWSTSCVLGPVCTLETMGDKCLAHQRLTQAFQCPKF